MGIRLAGNPDDVIQGRADVSERGYLGGARLWIDLVDDDEAGPQVGELPVQCRSSGDVDEDGACSAKVMRPRAVASRGGVNAVNLPSGKTTN